MSGGILGVAALSVVAIPLAGLYGVGKIAAMGSSAAYENIQIAAEANREIRRLKVRTNSLLDGYNKQSDRILSQVENELNNDICRLKTRMMAEGFARAELAVAGTPEQQLIRLSEIYSAKRSTETAVRKTRIRSYRQIYENITRTFNPILAELPESTVEFSSLTQFISEANRAVNADADAFAKAENLLRIEQEMLCALETYQKAVRKYSQKKAQFISLVVALRRLSEMVGETYTAPDFLPNDESQIRKMQEDVVNIRARATKLVLSNEAYLQANKALSERLSGAIGNAGYQRVSSRDESYGHVSIHQFNNSLITLNVSNEGVVSINLVGARGETQEQLEQDEKVFCDSGLEKLLASFEKEGICFRINQRADLSEIGFFFETEEDEDDNAGARSGGKRRRYVDYPE